MQRNWNRGERIAGPAPNRGRSHSKLRHNPRPRKQDQPPDRDRQRSPIEKDHHDANHRHRHRRLWRSRERNERHESNHEEANRRGYPGPDQYRNSSPIAKPDQSHSAKRAPDRNGEENHHHRRRHRADARHGLHRVWPPERKQQPHHADQNSDRRDDTAENRDHSGSHNRRRTLPDVSHWRFSWALTYRGRRNTWELLHSAQVITPLVAPFAFATRKHNIA